MKTTIRTVSLKDLDLDEFAQLQQCSFRKLLRAQGFTENHLTPYFFDWKYNGPFGQAVINLSLIDGRMVASSTIMPMRMMFGDKQFTVWNCMDNASLPELLSTSNFRGAFQASLMYPQSESMVYGFPNQNAMNTIIKSGGEIKQIIPYYIRPILAMPFWKYTQTIEEVSPGVTCPDVITHFFTKDELNLVKNDSYFNWRYKRHPLNGYKIYVSRNAANNISGFIVVRNVVFKSLNFILIMELYSEKARIGMELLQHVQSLYRNPVLAVSISNARENYSLKHGFIRFPDMLLPKKQIMTTFNRGLDSKIYQAPLKIQSGDWDSF